MQLKSYSLSLIGMSLFILNIFYQNFLFALIDLDENKQNFVLETKQIHIPGYPGCFNPSIVRWNDMPLLSFRIRDPSTASTNQIGLIWLDEKFNPIGQPYLLNHHLQAYKTCEEQDPRFFTIDDRLYMVYSNTLEKGKKETRQMFIAQVHFDGIGFFINQAECLNLFEGKTSVQEKNWVPFVYKNKAYLSYSLNPHRILRPLLNGTGQCEMSYQTKGKIDWNWGQLRGGTTALLNHDQYLAFFHSSKDLETTQSQGKRVVHYFMGAYTFSAHPPFEITGVSSEPIVCKDFYNGPSYQTWKPLRVVFPCGFVQDDRFVWVAYGKQDHEAWIVKMDKRKLLKSLVSISTVQ